MASTIIIITCYSYKELTYLSNTSLAIGPATLNSQDGCLSFSEFCQRWSLQIFVNYFYALRDGHLKRKKKVVVKCLVK